MGGSTVVIWPGLGGDEVTAGVVTIGEPRSVVSVGIGEKERCSVILS